MSRLKGISGKIILTVLQTWLESNLQAIAPGRISAVRIIVVERINYNREVH
jgi:hypothetical protein